MPVYRSLEISEHQTPKRGEKGKASVELVKIQRTLRLKESIRRVGTKIKQPNISLKKN